jgi:hypothetical protein
MSELQQHPEMACNASLSQCMDLSGCRWLDKAGFGVSRIMPRTSGGTVTFLVCPSFLPGNQAHPYFLYLLFLYLLFLYLLMILPVLQRSILCARSDIEKETK